MQDKERSFSSNANTILLALHFINVIFPLAFNEELLGGGQRFLSGGIEKINETLK